MKYSEFLKICEYKVPNIELIDELAKGAFTLKTEEDLGRLLFLLSQGKSVTLIPKNWDESKQNIFLNQNELSKYCFKSSVSPITKYNWEKAQVNFLSSGTTSTERVIPLSLSTLFESAKITNSFYDLNSKDIWPINLPLNHVSGLMIFIRSLVGGFKAPIAKNDWRDIIEEFPKANVLSLVPTQLSTLCRTHPKELFKFKAILVGGAPLSTSLWEKSVQLKLPLSPTYGMTETAAQVAAIKPNDFLNGIKFAEILPGRSLSINENNLIQIDDTLLPENITCPYLTSDIGNLVKGKLEVLGRADRMFISGGENIYPEKIESLIREKLGIDDVYVHPIDDSHFGKVPILFHSGIELSKNVLSNILLQHEIPKEFISLENREPQGIKFSKKELFSIYEDKKND